MKFYVHCEDPEIVTSHFINRFPEIFKPNTDIFLEFTARNKILTCNDIVSKKINDKDDVYVVIAVMCKQIEGKEFSPDTTDTVKEPDTADTIKETATTDTMKEPDPATTKSNNLDKTDTIKNLLTLAESLVQKSHIRRAILLYEDVIRIDVRNVTAYLGIVDCYLGAKRPQKALQYIRRLQKQQIDHESHHIKYRLGRCYIALGESDKAIEVLQKYTADLRKSGGTNSAHKHQIQVLMAKAYIIKEEKDMALVILQGVLREDRTCVDALIEYASLIYPLGPSQSEEAMMVLLTLMANNRDDSYIKEKFSWICQQSLGLKVLESVAGKAWSDIASLVFIATSIREYGAIKEAQCIMKHACDLKKDEAHSLLTYVHMLELTEQHGDAVRLIRQFIESFPEMSIGNFICSDLQPVVHLLSKDYFFTNAEILLKSEPKKQNSNDQYDEAERYLLALLHTLVKILYIKGCVSFLRCLTEILDPLSDNRDLHLTNIRNEAAYFTCISKVLKTCDNLCFPQKGEKFVYFVGDSHCITPAWQHIQFKEEEYVIFPVLSTGTKIWHLRETSKFYPKENFYNAIKVIPSEATVILCFGEIDCREALLMCIEKARYDSLVEAIDTVINIYMDVIKDLYDRYHWDIYIHPVMPVLDITRSIVMQFNSSLKNRIQRIQWLKWLDFVDELLYKDQDSNFFLKDIYKFDGTHVHPCYTSLLQTSLTMVEIS